MTSAVKFCCCRTYFRQERLVCWQKSAKRSVPCPLPGWAVQEYGGKGGVFFSWPVRCSDRPPLNDHEKQARPERFNHYVCFLFLFYFYFVLFVGFVLQYLFFARLVLFFFVSILFLFVFVLLCLFASCYNVLILARLVLSLAGRSMGHGDQPRRQVRRGAQERVSGEQVVVCLSLVSRWKPQRHFVFFF